MGTCLILRLFSAFFKVSRDELWAIFALQAIDYAVCTYPALDERICYSLKRSTLQGDWFRKLNEAIGDHEDVFVAGSGLRKGLSRSRATSKRTSVAANSLSSRSDLYCVPFVRVHDWDLEALS